MEEVKIKIRNFLKRFYRRQQINDEDNILEIGFANSLFMVQLVTFLEREFNVDTNSIGQNYNLLNSINAIDNFVCNQSRKSEKTPFQMYELPNGMVMAHLNKAETDHFYNDIFENRSYLKFGISIPADGCVFDVGANIGMFSLFILKNFENVKVYAFEPVPPIFEVLSQNTAAYKEQIKLYNCGISKDERAATVTYYTGNSGMSSVYADEDQEKEVLRTLIMNHMDKDQKPDGQFLENVLDERLKKEDYNCSLKTISQIILENNVKAIDLIKIDVQKSEYDVLLGIEDNDWNKIRQIVIEVHDIGGRLESINKLLKEKGYKTDIEQDELYKGTVMFNIYAVRV